MLKKHRYGNQKMSDVFHGLQCRFIAKVPSIYIYIYQIFGYSSAAGLGNTIICTVLCFTIFAFVSGLCVGISAY